jgi:hypothetical protein
MEWQHPVSPPEEEEEEVRTAPPAKKIMNTLF